jgi:DNA mismatch endonuclease (patch repair protein)
MARVRQKNTTAEQVVGRALRRLGQAYRLNVRSLSGAPDFANKSRRWAIFVNGCFWHHHRGCYRATVPKANRGFWVEKFRTNRSRDARNIRQLRKSGYSVLVVWECRTVDEGSLGKQLSEFFESRRIRGGEPGNHGGVMEIVAGRRGR